jgi:hypothetical protein
MHPRTKEKASGGGQYGLSQKSFLPLTLPSVPSLSTPQGLATTPVAKCDALKARIFPPIPNADLTDIPSFHYPAK